MSPNMLEAAQAEPLEVHISRLARVHPLALVGVRSPLPTAKLSAERTKEEGHNGGYVG